MSLLYIFVPTECVPAKMADAIHFLTREKPTRRCRMELLRDRESRATTHSPFTRTPPFETLTMYQSVLQRVCSIPELLDLIFDHIDPTSNVNNAIVCKVWSEVARDKLWREVCGPRRLLSILAPISDSTGVSGVVIIRITFR